MFTADTLAAGEGELGTQNGGRGRSRNKAGMLFRINRSVSWYPVPLQIGPALGKAAVADKQCLSATPPKCALGVAMRTAGTIRLGRNAGFRHWGLFVSHRGHCRDRHPNSHFCVAHPSLGSGADWKLAAPVLTHPAFALALPPVKLRDEELVSAGMKPHASARRARFFTALLEFHRTAFPGPPVALTRGNRSLTGGSGGNAACGSV